MTKILIIIPCFNEEENILPLWDELRNFSLSDHTAVDYLFINDGSTDSSKLILQKNNIPHLNLPINLGIGGAVQSGFKYALQYGYDFAIQLDGDGQHPPAEIEKLWSERHSADIVIGSRFIEKQGFQTSRTRRVGIRILATWSRLLTGVYIYDITSGFRMLNKRAIEVAAKHYPDNYPEPEMIALFAGNGYTISEIPVTMRARKGGSSSIKNWFNLFYMFKVGLGILFMSLKKL